MRSSSRLRTERGSRSGLAGAPSIGRGVPRGAPARFRIWRGRFRFTPEPEGLSGVVVVADRHVQGHGYPDAPVVARLDSGWLVETSGGDVAERLLHALRDYADQQVFAVSHLSLGLLPSASGEETTVAMERAPGSLVLGLGSQPPGLGVFGETAIQTEVHVDLVARRLLRFGGRSMDCEGRNVLRGGIAARRDDGVGRESVVTGGLDAVVQGSGGATTGMGDPEWGLRGDPAYTDESQRLRRRLGGSRFGGSSHDPGCSLG